MKISLRWLNDYVDVSDYFSKPKELAEILTQAGLEVESIQDSAAQFKNVVVGHILERGVHPQADRLTLCQVAVGDGKVLQIVCGAKNHKQGDRVVAALPGAVLPGDFAIKISKIRNVESFGMLCSESELGFKKESEGILILPADAPVGKPFAEYQGLDDILFELKVTPNRADCLSHFGLAREVSCLLGREYNFPLEPFPLEGESTRAQIKLEVLDHEMCPRYAGRMLDRIQVGPSPDWLRRRIEGVGLKSINNVVDVTNYVLMELGQPLHAFDVSKIRGAKILVERSKKGEKFTTLDGTELNLTGEELTIRDAEGPVALAGVIGGKNSGVDESTTAIFIESAYFNPMGVRRTSRRFGIETDSSYRFSRGVNPEAVALAMNRATQLVLQVAGGRAFSDQYDVYPKPWLPDPISISRATLEDSLGYSIDGKKFLDWMQRLGCKVQAVSENEWMVDPPSHRGDLNIDMDLVEEFGRLEGYDKIPEVLPPLKSVPSEHDAGFLFENRIRRVLQGMGFNQAINYGFIERQYQAELLKDADVWKKAGLASAPEAVSLVNPLNDDINVMRLSLLPGLLKNLEHNSRQGNSCGRLFELGKVHFAETKESEKYYREQGQLAFAVWGNANSMWVKPAPLIFSMKAQIEQLLQKLMIKSWRWEANEALGLCHPGQFATLKVEGKSVGFLGSLHPGLRDQWKVREEVVVGEFNLDLLKQGQPRQPKFKGFSRFPAIERDLAFLLPAEMLAVELQEFLTKQGGNLLQSVAVVDVFEGDPLPAGQKSVVYRMIFQSSEGTLDDNQINAQRDAMVNAACQKFSVTMR